MDTTIQPESTDAVFSDRVRRFQEFLDLTDKTDYKESIRGLLMQNSKRLTVSIDELRDFDKELWTGLLTQPAEFLPAAERALKDTIMIIYDPYEYPNVDMDNDSDYYLLFKGSFGDHQLTPRSINSSYLSKLVSIEGIVTRASLIRPKIIKSVHYCDTTGRFHQREYRDQTTSFNPISTNAVYPTEDPEGNKLVTEYGFSKYRDHQTVTIQELPEIAPLGQLPRSIDIIVDDDLSDLVKPGDRIQCIGVYRSLGNGANSSSFKRVILSNSIYLLKEVKKTSDITDNTLRTINILSKKKNIFEILAESLAPSIYGYDYIKKAVLLMLLGGVEKILPNGSHLRGDINILMVGDPSTAKSQMLRFVLNTAQLAIATTGKGSSGVGLTAAVTTDRETGERKLEAGAMVLADRGVVCIDEFDKMSDADRVAIHEVMEQQTITISKAGIHTSLNARCSVIAAANPVYGQYDVFKTPQQNIALPDSLLSRFDVLFIVTDDVSDEKDRRISEHVLNMHRYIAPGYEEGEPIREQLAATLSAGDSLSRTEDDEQEEKVFVRGSETSKNVVVSVNFLKKYIQYAKQRVKPVLTAKASARVVKFYSELRNDANAVNTNKTSPITARTLETIIRLSTAHAKLRLSQIVESKDVKVAEEILRFSIFKEVAKKSSKRHKAARVLEDSDDESDIDLEDSESEPSETEYIPRSTRSRNIRTPNRLFEEDEEEEEEEAPEIQQITTNLEQLPLQPAVGQVDEDSISQLRLQQFTRIMSTLIQSDLFTDENCALETLVAEVNKDLSEENKFSQLEFDRLLEIMGEKNQVLVSDGKVWRV